MAARAIPKAVPLTARRPEPAGPLKRLGLRLWRRAKVEAQKLLPAWLFFYLSFSLLRLTQTAVLQEHGVTILPPSKVLAGSLIVAKALLTVDSLRLFARLENRPIIVTALLKTFVYALVTFFFEYSAALVELRGLGLAQASQEFAHRLASLRFWVIQVWLVVLLFAFSGARTLARRLGRRRFRRLFLGR